MLPRRFKLTSLPREGAWFIRWIDGFAKESPSKYNPWIIVTLERLRGDRWRGVSFDEASRQNDPVPQGQSAMPYTKCYFHAGVITGLAIGDVIEGGQHVGYLSATIVDFSFCLPDDLLGIDGPGDDLGLMPISTSIGKLFGIKDERSLIPYKLYSTHTPADCVSVLRSSNGLLILPSALVIRAFISPIGAVIRDLVCRPPQDPASGSEPQPLLHQVLGPGTHRISDDRWQIALDDKVAERHAPLIANLHPDLSYWGGRAANRVHEGVRDTPSTLAGALPFRDCTLQMSVRVHHLASDRMLALDVTSARWPYAKPTSIDVLRWHPERDPADDPRFLHRGRASSSTEGETAATSYEDPDPGAELVLWDVGGVTWDGLPDPETRYRPFLRDPHRFVRMGGDDAAELASFGGPGYPSDVAAVTFNQNPPFDVAPIARFERVAAMFDKLAADDQRCPGSGIHHWTVIEPEKANHRASAGGRQVWRFQTNPPLRSNWVWWNPLSRSRRVRTVFICAVQITTLGYVTWMEIEGRDEGDVYTALIMPGRLADDEIITLIEAVRKKRDFRGVDFSKVLPKRPLPRLWKHQWENGTSELRSAPAHKNILQAMNS